MVSDRARHLRLLLGADDDADALPRLCSMCLGALRVDRAGISRAGDGGALVTLAATDVQTAWIQEIQYVFGEGPCVEAVRSGTPVSAPDLEGRPAARWPVFTRAAGALGIRAAFAFPLRPDGPTIGVLGLFRSSAGILPSREFAVAARLVDRANRLLIGPGGHGSAAAMAPLGVDDQTQWHAEVHLAADMVAVQLGIPVDRAFVRLRARAFVTGRLLGDLSREVVTGALRFQDSDDGP